MIELSIGLGVVFSLVFNEVFGAAAGGIVVPGYIALHLAHPMDVVLTLAMAFVTFAIVHLLSSIIIVYGRRRTVLMILVGTGTYIFARAASRNGLDMRKVVYAEKRRVGDIFETVVSLAGRTALVMGMCNIGGQGLELVQYFRNRSTLGVTP